MSNEAPNGQATAAAPAAAATPATPAPAAAAPAAPATTTQQPAAPATPDTPKPADAAAPVDASKMLVDPNAKPADAKATEVKAVDGAPEKYEPFKLPEGTAPDTAVLTELEAVAKEFNLPQAAAQKFADLGAKYAQGLHAKQEATLKAASEAWHQQSINDKEFGGDKYDANLATARKGLETFASPGLRDMLVKSGLQTHPEIVRMFVKVGALVSEDNNLVTNPGGGMKPNANEPFSMSKAASVIYGQPKQATA